MKRLIAGEEWIKSIENGGNIFYSSGELAILALTQVCSSAGAYEWGTQS
jgi:hypothetical protein